MNKKMTKEQQQLVTQNIKLAEGIARHIGYRALKNRKEKSITMDDLEMEAQMGLIEAALRYDSTQGTEFSTMAYHWCRKYVLRALHKYGTPLSTPDNFNGVVETLQLDAIMKDDAVGDASGDDDGSPADRLFYAMFLALETELTADEDRREMLKQAMSSLREKDRKVLVCLFALEGEGNSMEETAEMLGVTPNRILEIKEVALRKLEIALAA